jgi:hypothetical protein
MVLGNTLYLTFACPFDLTGDEAHYWDWSRQLDWSYYSKGPAVAAIIRASCALFGDTMPAVRLPASLFAVGSALSVYWLTRKLFASDRLALSAVLLMLILPLFSIGSILMTIDPPFFFCWSLATCLAAKAVLDDVRWPWPLIGLVVGLGALAKYAMLLWGLSLLIYLVIDAPARKCIRGRFWLALLAALPLMLPMVLWNMDHDWVSFRHVSAQTGLAQGGFSLAYLPKTIVDQIGIVGPLLYPILIVAIVWAWRMARKPSQPQPHAAPDRRRAMRFLLAIGLPILLLTVLGSLRAKPQPNWPVTAYFTLLIAMVAFLADQLHRPSWRFWRWLLYPGLATALLGSIGARNLQPLYPLFEQWGLHPRSIDPSVKFTGYGELAHFIDAQLHNPRVVGPNALVMAYDYQTASQLAFHLPRHPPTYCLGNYFSEPDGRRRMTQFDIWPDRQLDQPQLRGLDAIFVGRLSDARYRDLETAFGRAPTTGRTRPHVELLKELPIQRNGVTIRTFQVWRCRDFQGMSRPLSHGTY